MKLKDKVALVTGASRGIGKAIAIRLAQDGCHVVVNYIKEVTQANAVVKTIEKLGRKAIAIQADVADEKQVKAMVEKSLAFFGQTGIVFDVPLFERTVEQWKRTMEVNLLGVFLCSKYVAYAMKKKKTGTIINIASTNGIHTYHPDSIDYSATKAGVINLTKSLAHELSPFIRVNCVAPGWVDTDMNKELPKDYIKKETEHVYLKRFAKPEEMASVVSFLASEDASYMTGSILVVDGGYP